MVEPVLGPRRPRLYEVGVLLIVVGVPLAFLPMSAGPFVDVKIAVVLLGCVAMWAGAPPADGRLASAAAVWVGVLAVSGFMGVDRWWGLAGVENLGSGLILLGPSAYLLVAGASMPAALTERVPRWLLGAAIPVSLLVILWRFVPQVPEAMVRDLSFEGSTLGHPVLVSGFCTTALLAATAVRIRRPVWFLAAIVVVSSGLSLTTKRAGLVALAVGFAMVWWRAREGRRHVTRTGVVVLAVLLAWAAMDATLAPSEGLSAAPRFGELATDSARARVVIHEVLLRAWLERPVLGWGTGATWSAYLSTATPEEVEIAQRGVADAHDIVLGTAVASGVLGLAALLWLGWLTVRRARRGPSELAWVVGAATGLLVFHLLQPMSAPLTPLLFLLAGISVSGRSEPGREGQRAGRFVIGALLAAGFAVSLLLLGSSVLEQWGRTFNSQWALRSAHALAPGRVAVVETLAIYRAQDGAAAEARELVGALLQEHPAHPGVRMAGMRVELVLDDPSRAHAWLERQVDVFPGDVAAFPDGMIRFLRTGQVGGSFPGLQSAVAEADHSG